MILNKRFLKVKKLFVNILGGFIPSRKLRQRMRQWFYTPKIMDGQNRLPLRRDAKVAIAFSFDKNNVNLAAVAFRSLFSASKNRCDYDIYCIVDDSVLEEHKQLLQDIVDKDSTLTFLQMNNDFDKSYFGKWSTPIVYLRLMLPRLLPSLDRIIYADTDTLFLGDLSDANRIDIGNNLVAGVCDHAGTYINAGFLIMNLKLIRAEGLYEKWITMSQKGHFKFLDQDIINITCRGRILYLPLKYNVRMYAFFDIGNNAAYPDRDFYDLRYHTVMLHWAGGNRPWGPDGKHAPYSKIWWKYAKIK